MSCDCGALNGDALDRAAFDGFSLALRVMVHAFEIDALAARSSRSRDSSRR
jgi:hypothetical protein